MPNQPASLTPPTAPPVKSGSGAVGMLMGSVGGLVVGLALGIAGHETGSTVLAGVGPYIKAFGAGWMNALTALVLPLMVANIVTAVLQSRDARATGKISAYALGLFVAALLLGTAFTLVVVPPFISVLPLDANVAASLSATLTPAARAAAATAPALSTPSDIVSVFIPRNVFKSAVNDDLLPILIFSIAFGFAVSHVRGAGRDLLAAVFSALAEALLVLVSWILKLLPLGAFALAYSFSAGAGMQAAGVLAQFTLITCASMLAFTALLYPVSALLGGVSLRQFALAVLPAQISAVSTRSSIASLPALLQGAQTHLRMDPAVANLALPLSVAVFKVNRTISSTVKMLFIAHLFGVSIGPAQIVVFTATIVMLSFTSLGVPGGGTAFKSMAAYLAVGLPIEGVILLEAVDVIADVFKTLLNVTGDMSVAVILNRFAAAAPAFSPRSPALPADPA
jgi:proton glutamate symport protein